MSDDMKRILVVEDEKHIAEGLRLSLTLEGFDVSIASDGASALRLWKTWMPDLIVLDIMLPVIDGMAVLKGIRLEDQKLPVLILSAKGDSEDRIKGLKYGSDDYLAKPFNLEEFLLRVRRLLKRSGWETDKNTENAEKNPYEDGIYEFGVNRIDFNSGLAFHGDEKISLTQQEIKLIKLFIINKGKPLSRAKLLEVGWGYSRGMSTRTVDNFIVRLRKYFEEDPKNPEFFKSRRSVGYVFEHGV